MTEQKQNNQPTTNQHESPGGMMSGVGAGGGDAGVSPTHHIQQENPNDPSRK